MPQDELPPEHLASAQPKQFQLREATLLVAGAATGSSEPTPAQTVLAMRVERLATDAVDAACHLAWGCFDDREPGYVLEEGLRKWNTAQTSASYLVTKQLAASVDHVLRDPVHAAILLKIDPWYAATTQGAEFHRWLKSNLIQSAYSFADDDEIIIQGEDVASCLDDAIWHARDKLKEFLHSSFDPDEESLEEIFDGLKGEYFGVHESALYEVPNLGDVEYPQTEDPEKRRIATMRAAEANLRAANNLMRAGSVSRALSHITQANQQIGFLWGTPWNDLIAARRWAVDLYEEVIEETRDWFESWRESPSTPGVSAATFDQEIISRVLPRHEDEFANSDAIDAATQRLAMIFYSEDARLCSSDELVLEAMRCACGYALIGRAQMLAGNHVDGGRCFAYANEWRGMVWGREWGFTDCEAGESVGEHRRLHDHLRRATEASAAPHRERIKAIVDWCDENFDVLWRQDARSAVTKATKRILELKLVSLEPEVVKRHIRSWRRMHPAAAVTSRGQPQSTRREK